MYTGEEVRNEVGHGDAEASITCGQDKDRPSGASFSSDIHLTTSFQ